MWRKFFLFAVLVSNVGQITHDGRKVVYIPHTEARPILESLSDVIPQELKTSSGDGSWQAWVASRDKQIRARLDRGDEDSLVNLLLFGTSFTNRPRITIEALAQVGRNASQSSSSSVAFMDAVRGRADDMVRALQAPGDNERLIFALKFSASRGYDINSEQ